MRSISGKHLRRAAAGFTAVALVFYIPAGYYLELVLYRRRQRKGLTTGSGGGTKKR